VADPTAATKVSVTFLNAGTKLIERMDVNASTTLGAMMVATRNVCQDVAVGKGWKLFAIPSFVTKGGGERWLVFQVKGSMAVLLRDWPTRDSAEMWMQHNG
jgi:hypothetical protein